ncbi:MAG: N-acetylneuraminate synthase family protein [Bdellovibrionales bacterium]|nr:N-acetylneuraminate synthase family protein [Bdellovibrionales bacterium]
MSLLIAEIGQNHNGDLSLAIELIHAAAEHGADVAKFQIYDAKALFPREGNEWFDYNCRTELSRDAIGQLSEECKKCGIEFMASVFDVERVGWCEEIEMKRYKVASRSVRDSSLLDRLSITEKPLIISLGHWNEPALPIIRANRDVAYLYCIARYPTELADIDFSTVDFKKFAGFSDHTVGLTAAMVALSRGASIIEKHFTLDKTMYGPDHSGSMTPDELGMLNKFRTELSQCLR